MANMGEDVVTNSKLVTTGVKLNNVLWWTSDKHGVARILTSKMFVPEYSLL